MEQDGLYIETENGPQRLNVRDEQADKQFEDKVKNEAKREALLSQQEINQATQQAHQYGQQIQLQQVAAKFLRENPDLQQHQDLLGYELQQTAYDPVNDPYSEKRLAEAGERVRAGIKRLDKAWHKEQELKHGSGLALHPFTGQLVESVPDPDVSVEEPGETGNSYVDAQRARWGDIRKTFANTGRA